MKYKNSAIIFSLILMFSIFNLPFASAYSPLVLYCEDGTVLYSGECNTQEEIWDSVEPSKGGFFDKLRITLANPETKVKLEATLVAGQIAYLEKSLEEGNYKEVRGAANDIRTSLKKSGRYLEEFGDEKEFNYGDYSSGVGPFYDYRYIEPQWTHAISEMDRVKGMLLAKVEAGELTQENANEMLGGMAKESDELSIIFQNKEDEFIDKMIENSDTPLTRLEIKYELRDEDLRWGLEDAYYNIDRGDIAYNKFTLDLLKKEISESDDKNIADVDELFMQARIAQQDARDALVNENSREAYENFQEAEYFIGVLEEYNREGGRALVNINPLVDKTFEEINQEIEEENKQIIEEYKTEGLRDKIIENYPEYTLELDRTYDEAVKIDEVNTKISEIEETKIAELENTGLTEEEAKAEVEELTTKEYFYADGGKDYPVGYVEFTDDNEDGIVETNYGGGWMKGIPYTDYSSNFDYTMGGDGFTIQSPLTDTSYLVNYPADYTPKRFEMGDEVFEYRYETEEGKYSVEYIGEGVILHKPDGTSEFTTNYADISPVVVAVGGTEFRYGAAGYDVISDGEATRWTVNPVFGNYEDLVSGKNFVPEFPHYGDMVYTDRVYEYTVGETRVEFDPITNIFTINGVTTIFPPIPEAPVGFEDNLVKEQMITEHGEVWTYDKNTATWTSTKTDSEGNVKTTEIVTAPNELYRYDEVNDEYIDTNGEEILEPVLAGEKWEEVGGKWISDSGVAYDPVTGTTYTPEGEVVDDGSFFAEGATIIPGVDDGRDIPQRGTIYDNGNLARKSTYALGGRYIYNPTLGVQGDYVFTWKGQVANYDFNSPPSQTDSAGKTWTMSPDGRWYAGTPDAKIYSGYENYYQSNAFAEVGRRVTASDGKEYFVDSVLGWATTDAQGNAYAVGPPSGQPGSSVMTGRYYTAYDDYNSRYDRNYNYVAEGKNYYFPSGIDPGTLTAEQKEKYSVNNARGYDPAFNTCYGDCAAGGYSRYTGYGATPGITVGTTYTDNGGAVWTKTEQGDWTSSDGRTYGIPPSYTYNTQVYSPGAIQDYGMGYRDYTYYGSYSTAGPSGGAYSPVGTTVVGDNGQTYTVTADKGWTDASGNAVAPPTVGGYQQPSSTGSSGSNYNAGYYNSAGTWVPPSSTYTPGTYSGGYYDSSGSWIPSSSGTSTEGYTYVPSTGSYVPSGSYYSPGTYDSATGTYSGSYYSGGYTGGGGYDASGNYVGGEYGGYSSTGTYTGGNYYSSGAYATGGYQTGTYDATTGTYSYPSGYNTASGTGTGYAYDSSTGAWTSSGSYTGGYPSTGTYTYSGGTYDAATGTYSGGTAGGSVGAGTYDSATGTYTYSGGDTSTGGTGTYSGGDTSTSTGGSTGTSSSTSSGGDSGGTTGGDGGGTTGGVVSDSEKVSSGNWFRDFWKKLFG